MKSLDTYRSEIIIIRALVHFSCHLQSPMYALKGPKMLKKDHAPNFPLQHAHKDMKLAVDMAKGVGVEYAVTEEAEKLLREAREDKDLNIAEDDFSAVFEKIHKESTSEFSKKRN